MAGTGTAGTFGAAGTTGSGGTTGGGGAGGTVCLETNPPPSLAAECSTCIAQYEVAGDGCCDLATIDPTGFSVCQAVSSCIRPAGCNALGDTGNCYCGTHTGTCDTVGQPNGPCVSQITAAAGRNITTKTTDVPTPSQVLTRFGDTAFAIGRATSVQSYAGGFCSTECGVGM
jgi:hypothetical protein